MGVCFVLSIPSWTTMYTLCTNIVIVYFMSSLYVQCCQWFFNHVHDDSICEESNKYLWFISKVGKSEYLQAIPYNYIVHQYNNHVINLLCLISCHAYIDSVNIEVIDATSQCGQSELGKLHVLIVENICLCTCQGLHVCLEIWWLIFSCDSSSIRDNVRRSVGRSVRRSVTNEFQSLLYSFRITVQCIEYIQCIEYNA